MGPVPVTIETVEERSLTDWTELTGRIEAVESVEIRPRVSGELTEVHFKAGALVAAGDPLFSIDVRPHQARLDQAKAEQLRAEAAAFAAEREFSRAADLLKARAISPEQADARESAHRQAQAALAAAKAAVAAAALDVEFCSVRAPVSGRVGRALVTRGNIVSGQPGTASLLTTLVSVDPVWVYADLDEHTYLRLQAARRGRTEAIPAELQLAGESGHPHKGEVESLDNRVDPGTGSMIIRARFPNPDSNLTPGLFARLRLPVTGTWKGVVVSDAAIQTDLARKFVYVVDEAGLAQYRAVVLGDVIEGRRVIREGLKPGEKIVVRGHARLFMPGMPVVAAPAESAAPAQP
jgi:RND family efflux transporter MFP subunit